MTPHSAYVWHHLHCKWHHIHSLWHYTALFMTSSPLYLMSYPLFLTSRPLYLSSHPHFWWYHTFCMCHMTPTICITLYTLYKASHPHLMASHQIIYDTISTVSLSSHPDYQSHNPHCMYDIRATICKLSYELHMTSHPLFMISHHSMT